MSFTRFHDDPARLEKYAEETSYAGRYYLDVPGMGTNMPFFEDPHVRLQQWGANLTSNTIHLESDLRGLTRPLTHDNIDENDYKKKAAPVRAIRFGDSASFVEETRASHPAWTYRDLEQPRWEHPFINPQANVELQFPSNVQTRILEKDYHRAKVPIFAYLDRGDTFSA